MDVQERLQIRVLDNPLSKAWDEVKYRTQSPVWNQAMDRIKKRIWDQIYSQVALQILNQLDESNNPRGHIVRNIVRALSLIYLKDYADSQVRGHTWDQVWVQVEDHVRDRVWRQVDSQLVFKIWTQVANSVQFAVYRQIRDQTSK